MSLRGQRMLEQAISAAGAADVRGATVKDVATPAKGRNVTAAGARGTAAPLESKGRAPSPVMVFDEEPGPLFAPPAPTRTRRGAATGPAGAATQGPSLVALGRSTSEPGWGGSEPWTQAGAARPLPLPMSMSMQPLPLAFGAQAAQRMASLTAPLAPCHSSPDELHAVSSKERHVGQASLSSLSAPPLQELSHSTPPRTVTERDGRTNDSNLATPASVLSSRSRPTASLPGTPFKQRYPGRTTPGSSQRSLAGLASVQMDLYASGVLESEVGRNMLPELGRLGGRSSASVASGGADDRQSVRSGRSAASGSTIRRGFGLASSSNMSVITAFPSQAGRHVLPGAPVAAAVSDRHSGSLRAKRMVSMSMSAGVGSEVSTCPSPHSPFLIPPPTAQAHTQGIRAGSRSGEPADTSSAGLMDEIGGRAVTASSAHSFLLTSANPAATSTVSSAANPEQLFLVPPPEKVVRTRRQAAQERLALSTHKPQAKAARLNGEGRRIGVRFTTPRASAAAGPAATGADADEEEEGSGERSDWDEDEDMDGSATGSDVISVGAAGAAGSPAGQESVTPPRAGMKRPRPASPPSLLTPAGPRLEERQEAVPALGLLSQLSSQPRSMQVDSVLDGSSSSPALLATLVGGTEVPIGALPANAILLLDQFPALDQCLLILRRKGRAGLPNSPMGTGISTRPAAQAVGSLPPGARLTSLPVVAQAVGGFTHRTFTRVHLAQMLGIAPGCLRVVGLRLGSDGEFLGPASFSSGSAHGVSWQLVIDGVPLEEWPCTGSDSGPLPSSIVQPLMGSLARFTPPRHSTHANTSETSPAGGVQPRAATGGKVKKSPEEAISIRRAAFNAAMRSHFARAHATYLRARGCTGPAHALWPKEGAWASGFAPDAVPIPAAELPMQAEAPAHVAHALETDPVGSLMHLKAPGSALASKESDSSPRSQRADMLETGGDSQPVDPRLVGLDPALIARVRARSKALENITGPAAVAARNIATRIAFHSRVLNSLFTLCTIPGARRTGGPLFLETAASHVHETITREGCPASTEAVQTALTTIARDVAQSWCSLATVTLHAGAAAGSAGAMMSDAVDLRHGTSTRQIIRVLKPAAGLTELAAIQRSLEVYLRASIAARRS